MKTHVFEKIKCQEATWRRFGANLGAKKAPNGSPRGSQNGAKKEKKNEAKLREVKSAQRGAEVK